jgi:hypothetical protein
MKVLAILICGLVASSLAIASDHIDGPVTTKHRVGDLTDLYAFPTPQKKGSISVILDTYPLVGTSGHFSDKVDYTLIVRRAERRDSNETPHFDTRDEVRITCHFKTPEVTESHSVSCKSSNGLNAEAKYNVVGEKREGDDFRLFAGMRSDPFFLNADFFTSLTSKGELSKPKDSNTMDYANVLSMSFEIDAAKLFKGNPPDMLAFAAESTTQDSPSSPVRRLDWVGRPEITNLGMSTRGEADLRDQFNTEQPFAISEKNKPLYAAQLAKNIGFYDMADHKQDWKDKDRENMGAILADDFLVLDTSKPCDKNSFLEIEQSMIKGRNHKTCGGRRPSDHIMDTYYTMDVSGIDGAPVHDGVTKPQNPVSSQFPYLADPDLSLWGRTRIFFAKKALGIKDPVDAPAKPAAAANLEVNEQKEEQPSTSVE